MAFEKHVTLDNVLKVLLAIAVGVLLYNVFFKKSEGYYNYQTIDKVAGNHAYPMDYEEDESDIPYTEPTEPYFPEESEEVFDETVQEGLDEEDDIVDEVVLDEAVDEEMYEYEETAEEPYDDSMEAVDEETEIPDEIYEEADDEETVTDEIKGYDYLYASDVEDGLQENFVLYENSIGEDTNYSIMKNEYLQ